MGDERRRVAKIIGAGFAALAIPLIFLFLGYGLGVSGGYYDAQADRRSEQIDTASRNRVEHCFRQSDTTIPATRECVEQAVRSSHEEQRSEQDLSAQRQMAQWAWWLLIVTAAQAPLTALGLVLLLQTIRQGQEAISIQRGETRPWLSFANLKVHHLNMIRPEEGEEGEPWLIAAVIEVEISNRGATPAKDICVLAHTVDNPLREETEAQVEHWAKHQIETGRGFRMGVLPPNGIGSYKYAVPCMVPYYDEHGAERRDVLPGVALAVTYRGIEDETLRQTVQMFRLSNVDPEQHSDTPQAHGFWLTHTSYPDRAITIIAGSKVDRAT